MHPSNEPYWNKKHAGRQSFRFRVPSWVMNATPTALRPQNQIQPTEPNTSVRPPFRPPGSVPSRPSKAQPRIRSQPPSPARTPSPLPLSPSASQLQATVQNVSQPPTSLSPIKHEVLLETEPKVLSPSDTPSHSRAAISQPQTPPKKNYRTLSLKKSRSQNTSSGSPTPLPSPFQKTSSPSLQPSHSPPPLGKERDSQSDTKLSNPHQKFSQPSDDATAEKIVHQSVDLLPSVSAPVFPVGPGLHSTETGKQSNGEAKSEENPIIAHGGVSTTQHPTSQKEVIRDKIPKLATNQPQRTNDEENPVSVITLTGENKGATMNLGYEGLSTTESPIKIHRGYKVNHDDISNSTDGENSTATPMHNVPKSRQQGTNAAYINNNTQNLNNSIITNSSTTENSPGVHVNFNHYVNVNDEPMKIKSNVNPAPSVETKTEHFNVSKPEKQPRIRRRCLGGLLMESSDSDPNKPRRHGCRYASKNKEKE